ncbi:hypothetical protein PG994_015249 [Apiospora phragmitis]|uniref:Uncharacterized protein n=1 Tax=Apiospora phragmitis TaxID=2905665 RepID=A0ABR1SQZ7_9PEZI
MASSQIPQETAHLVPFGVFSAAMHEFAVHLYNGQTQVQTLGREECSAANQGGGAFGANHAAIDQLSVDRAETPRLEDGKLGERKVATDASLRVPYRGAGSFGWMAFPSRRKPRLSLGAP